MKKQTIIQDGTKLGQKIYTNINKVDYYNEKTNRWKIWKQKASFSLWHDIDYLGLVDGDKKMLGSLFLLLISIDNDNFVCRYDRRTRHHVPISTKDN